MIFDQIDKFAGYGFNKSHAAAYALVAYQTAYLKANYPVEFFAAAMNFELGDTDKLNVFRQELVRNRIALLPPDINRSYPVFAVEDVDGKASIRYALAAIKGVGMAAMQSMVVSREKGAFRDLFDMAERVGTQAMNRKQMEKSGIRRGIRQSEQKPLANYRVDRYVAENTASKQIPNVPAGRSICSPPRTAMRGRLCPRRKTGMISQSFSMNSARLASICPLILWIINRAILERIGAVPVHQISSRQRATGPNRFKLAGHRRVETGTHIETGE